MGSFQENYKQILPHCLTMTLCSSVNNYKPIFLIPLVYRHNFPGVNHGSGNICGLKPEVLEKKGIEAIFMSPPCQPFTRQGLKKDLQVLILLLNEMFCNHFTLFACRISTNLARKAKG
jgi:hypothetical protein